ncbi:C-C chemokine receptor type 4 [Channa argus]|uniref:C-C chemokine receptor type 4 n=1 Tax=Channa argus TaxID=215402 RepID=UPI003521840E
MATTISSLTAFSNSENHSSSFTTEYYDYSDYPDYDFGRCVYERHGARFLPTLYAMFFILGLLGNSLVIWVTVSGVRLRNMTDVCLLNLAIADLLLVCCLPFLAHQAWDEWLFGEAMCKMVLGIYNIVFYCGVFFITLMSIDRYLAIVHAVYAMRARTRSLGMIAAIVTWGAGFLASFPEVVFLKVQYNGTSQFCFPVYSTDPTGLLNSHFWRVFSILKRNILGLLFPLLIMGFCYSQIIWTLLKSQKFKKQAIHVVLVAVAVFVCCWVPYNIALFFKALELLQVYTECNSSKAIVLVLQVTEAIAYSHSCLNPILYVFVGKKFRTNLLRLIGRTPCGLCRLIKVYILQDRIPGSVYSQTTSVDDRSTAM